MSRTLSRKVVPAPPAPGFIGEGHTAVEVVRPSSLASSDPFVLLMDDRLDIAHRRKIGGAHPHAGLETVTLVLEGTLFDRDEGAVSAGDVIWMTAGRGIIHNEDVEAVGRSRILQLWIGLSARDRRAEPRFEVVKREAALTVRAPGVEGRLYSGSSGALRSPTKNHVPVTLLDLSHEARATFTQDLPRSYNGFVYVLEGSTVIGTETLRAGEVGWFSPSSEPELTVVAGEAGARVVLYAGEPIGEPLVQHGPFVAGSMQEIAELHHAFRAGRFTSMGELVRASKRES